VMIKAVLYKNDIANLYWFRALVVARAGIIHICQIVEPIFVHFHPLFGIQACRVAVPYSLVADCQRILNQHGPAVLALDRSC
jgi:hypothetical protein